MYDITFEVRGKKSVERLPHAALMMQAGGSYIFPSCLFLLLPAQARLPGFSPSMPRFVPLNFSQFPS
jgi:hypothetical protein